MAQCVRMVRVGTLDPSLTGVAVVTELVDRLDVIGQLDAVIGADRHA